MTDEKGIIKNVFKDPETGESREIDPTDGNYLPKAIDFGLVNVSDGRTDIIEPRMRIDWSKEEAFPLECRTPEFRMGVLKHTSLNVERVLGENLVPKETADALLERLKGFLCLPDEDPKNPVPTFEEYQARKGQTDDSE